MGYKVTKLEDICDFEKGTTGLAKATPGEYPLVTTGANRKTCENFQFDKSAVCIPLVSSTGHGHASLNYVHYQKGKFALGTILVALTSKDDSILDIQFLHLYLFQLKNQILVPLMTGAANVSLSIKKIKKIEIPLPSIERQKEIVKNFNLIEMEDEELRKELIHQETILKKLRQQILLEAIEGKLTKNWRDDNPNIEPANKLLKRIKVEKEQLIKDKKIKKQIPLPPISEEEKPFEIPETWEWCRLGDIVDLIMGQSPSGDTYNKVRKGLPFFQGKKEFGEVYPIGNSTWCSAPKRVSQINDILISVRAPVGDVNIADKVYAIGRGLSIIRSFAQQYLNFWFLFYLLRAEQNNWKKKGSFFDAINRNVIENKLIALPSTNEKKAIVTNIEKLFAICDELEKEISENKIYSEQLMQTVLREAFEGEDK
ncbi:MAG: hypothetical protein DRJ01_12500 [Bacteroidetes bacterium]|nr:MAG: hypothetical protein DRJ01_12500 [Bacteroidota bacterium]